MAQDFYDNATSQGVDYEEANNGAEAIYQSCKWLTYLSEYLP